MRYLNKQFYIIKNNKIFNRVILEYIYMIKTKLFSNNADLNFFLTSLGDLQFIDIKFTADTISLYYLLIYSDEDIGGDIYGRSINKKCN
jgi:hypothetical protein